MKWTVTPIKIKEAHMQEIERTCPRDGLRDGKELTRVGFVFYMSKGSPVGIPVFFQIGKLQ